MATLTIYANTDDGYIWGNDTDYATARSTSISTDAGDALMIAGQDTDGLSKTVYRAFLRFVTSTATYPELIGATITAVEFGAYVVGQHNGEDYAMRVYRYAWASPLSGSQEANFDGAYGGSATYEGDLWANGFAPAAGAYATLAVDPAGINTGGYTSYTLASDNDVSAVEPSDTQYAEFATAETTGTTQDPYITITYTPAAGSTANVLCGPFGRPLGGKL